MSPDKMKRVFYHWGACYSILQTLSNLMPLVSFYTPWKHQKTRCFLMLFRSIERDHQHEMVWIPKLLFFAMQVFNVNFIARNRVTTNYQFHSSCLCYLKFKLWTSLQSLLHVYWHWKVQPIFQYFWSKPLTSL